MCLNFFFRRLSISCERRLTRVALHSTNRCYNNCPDVHRDSRVQTAFCTSAACTKARHALFGDLHLLPSLRLTLVLVTGYLTPSQPCRLYQGELRCKKPILITEHSFVLVCLNIVDCGPPLHCTACRHHQTTPFLLIFISPRIFFLNQSALSKRTPTPSLH